MYLMNPPSPPKSPLLLSMKPLRPWTNLPLLKSLRLSLLRMISLLSLKTLFLLLGRSTVRRTPYPSLGYLCADELNQHQKGPHQLNLKRFQLLSKNQLQYQLMYPPPRRLLRFQKNPLLNLDRPTRNQLLMPRSLHPSPTSRHQQRQSQPLSQYWKMPRPLKTLLSQPNHLRKRLLLPSKTLQSLQNLPLLSMRKSQSPQRTRSFLLLNEEYTSAFHNVSG